jgi:hypothetical protein
VTLTLRSTVGTCGDWSEVANMYGVLLAGHTRILLGVNRVPVYVYRAKTSLNLGCPCRKLRNKIFRISLPLSHAEDLIHSRRFAYDFISI